MIIMGANGVYSKVIPLDAITITQLRSVIAGIAIAFFILLQKQSFRLETPSHYILVVGLGLLMALHWCSFFYAMQISTVAIGILAHYSYPVITVIVEPLINNKTPARSDIFAGCAVLAGVALMVPNWDASSDVFIGVMFGLLSAVAFGARNILQRHCLQSSSSSSVMFYQLTTVAIVTAPFIDWQSTITTSAIDWQLLLLLGVISTAVTHTSVAFSLRTLSAKTVSLISCLQPPSAIILTWLVVGETPNTNTLIGGSIILAAAFYESIKVSKVAAHP